MYLQVPLLLSMVTSALALPNSNQTTSTLEKRAHYGWIGSFINDNCRGAQLGPRPELQHSISDCCAFSPAPNNIGINFGTSVNSFSDVKFYSDSNCQHVVPGRNTDYSKPSGGYGCMHISDYEGSIGSVSISS